MTLNRPRPLLVIFRQGVQHFTTVEPCIMLAQTPRIILGGHTSLYSVRLKENETNLLIDLGKPRRGKRWQMPKPNVLIVSVDDVNHWVTCLDGYLGVKTPNIDRLAQRGVLSIKNSRQMDATF